MPCTSQSFQKSLKLWNVSTVHQNLEQGIPAHFNVGIFLKRRGFVKGLRSASAAPHALGLRHSEASEGGTVKVRFRVLGVRVSAFGFHGLGLWVSGLRA